MLRPNDRYNGPVSPGRGIAAIAIVGAACGGEPAPQDQGVGDGSSGSDGSPHESTETGADTSSDGGSTSGVYGTTRGEEDTGDSTTGGGGRALWCFVEGPGFDPAWRKALFSRARLDDDERDDLIADTAGRFSQDDISLLRNGGRGFVHTDGFGGLFAFGVERIDVDGDGLTDFADLAGHIFLDDASGIRLSLGDGTLADPQPLMFPDVGPDAGVGLVPREGEPAAAMRREGSALHVWPGQGDGTFGRELVLDVAAPPGSESGQIFAAPQLGELALGVYGSCRDDCVHLRYLMVGFDGTEVTELGLVDAGEMPTSAHPQWGGLGDFDGDGHADPLVRFRTAVGLEYRVFFSADAYDVGLVFDTQDTNNAPLHAIGDIDADSRSDLVVADESAGTVVVRLSSLDHASILVEDGLDNPRVSLADLDGDGADDLLVSRRIRDDFPTIAHLSRACGGVRAHAPGLNGVSY